MNKIIFPLKLEMKGTEVSDLQDALQLLLSKALILKDNEKARLTLSDAIKEEQDDQFYGKFTREIVGFFQKEHELETSGEVDEPTADAINAILRELELLGQEQIEVSRVVSGQVRRDDGTPLKGNLVRAFHKSDNGTIRLGEDTTDVDGRYTIYYRVLPKVIVINLQVQVMNEKGDLLQASDTIMGAGKLEIIDLITPSTAKPITSGLIEGRVMMEHRLPAKKMTLCLYRRDFGAPEREVGRTTTDEHGFYKLPYQIDSKSASFDIRALDANGKDITLSKPLHDLGKEERMEINLVALSLLQPLDPEYQRLGTDLKPYVDELKTLANARENSEIQELSGLNRRTGWDARLMALASKAGKLSADPKVDISQEALYGLFRFGLPSDKSLLAQMDVDILVQVLEKAKEAGIINLSDELKEEFKTQFETFTCKTLLEMPVPGTSSTYGSLLKEANLDDGDPESDKNAQKFASAYLRYSRGADLWVSALKAGLNSEQIQKLQFQGKLAFLTENSVKLTSHLQTKISDPKKRIKDAANIIEKNLIDGNYFLSSTWEAEVREAAGIGQDEPIDTLSEDRKKLLKEIIPLSHTSEKLEDSFRAYTGEMARKVRLSYPTQVVCQMVQNDEDVFNLGKARSATEKFMKTAAAKGFRLGQTPVESFIESHPEILESIDLEDVDVARQNMKTLYRVYQITPSNEAMTTMCRLGFNSAYDVVALPIDTFLERYGCEFPSIEQAKLTYSKAEQVNSTIFNVLTTIKKLDSDIQMYAISAPAKVKEEVKKRLITQSPTMESLFGSLDFCECEHCRSVFSPAAYLVDLLQFIDKNSDSEKEIEWKKQLEEWPGKHNGASYPFKNLDEQENYRKLWKEKNPRNNSEPNTEKTPYEVLFERRPDISNIPLTCENTNTALPYIDIVNEILEYYVANETLTEEAAHDTGDAATSELLAEPQNVIAEAYNKLQEACYPLNLPFDLWLETVRSFCNYFEMPLWKLLEIFRQGNELFVPTQPYDRNAVFIEYLGLSPAEYKIFTDPNPRDKWYELYGYQNSNDATLVKIDDNTGQRIDLNSAKTLSRRLGVSYKEIVEIAQTRFVNPNLDNLVILRKLGISTQDVMLYNKNREFYNQNRDLLGEKRADLSPENRKRFDALKKEEWEQLDEIQGFVDRLDNLTAQYSSSDINFKDWIENKFDEKTFDNILVLADQKSSCSFDSTTLCYANDKEANDIDFLKINLFVRLWRKLGWTIEETDLALKAFIPEKTPFDKDNLSNQPLKTALTYMAHLKFLDEKINFGKQSRIKLLTLWSKLDTTGKNPLYAQLFLNKSVLKSGEVFDEEAKKYVSIFDDPLGDYLSEARLKAIADRIIYEASMNNVKPEEKIDPADFKGGPKVSINYDEIRKVQSLSYQGILTDEAKQELINNNNNNNNKHSQLLEQLLEAVKTEAEEFRLIKGHMLALQGALGLTADDIAQIIKDAGMLIDTADLSLENVSLLYRYGLLAKALKLSISEMIVVKQLSGLNPFKPLNLNPNPLEKLSDDYSFETLRFIEIVEQIKDIGLKIEDLDYLLRHRFDEIGKYRPKKDASLAFIKTVADGVQSINNEYAMLEDPGSISDDALKQKLGLILSSGSVDKLMAMINGTAEFTVTKNIDSGEKLDPAAFKGEPSILQVSYNDNDTTHEQKLTFRGVLFDKEKAKLNNKYGSNLFASLLDKVQNSEREFFNKYLHNYFDDYSQLFALKSDEATKSEIYEKLMWAFGPSLVLAKPELLIDEILTDEILDKYLKLILPSDVADTFLKMFRGEVEFTATQKNVEPNEKLAQTFDEPYIKASYNEAQKEQTLIFQGVLLNTQSVELKTKYSSPLFAALLDEVQVQARKYYEFYEKNLLDFFTIADFDLLFKSIPQELSEEEKQKLKHEKYTRLAQEFLLYIWIYNPETFKRLLQEALNLVFSPENARTFLLMFGGKQEYIVIQKNVEPDDLLDQKIKEQNISVFYDPKQKERTFTFYGILLDAQSAELKAKYPSQTFASLLDEVQKQARSFYEQNLQSVLACSSFNLLFAVIPDGLNRDLKQKIMGLKKTRLVRAFMPVLKKQLTLQFILQKLTAQLSGDPALVEALVKDNQLLGDPQPLKEAFTSTAEYGLNVTFFESPAGEGEPLVTLVFNDAETSLSDTKNVPKPTDAKCALFEGYLEVPTPGDYRFYAAFKNKDGKANINGEVTLSFDHLPEPLLNGNTENGEISNYLELKSGTLYHFKLKLSNLGDGEARLLVQSETLPKDNLSRLKLYPQTAIERAESALVLLSKVLQIIQSFNLNEREVHYLLTHPADFEDLNLSKLPTSRVDNAPEKSKDLFSQFLRLAGYFSLKRDLAGGTDDLIGIFEKSSLDQVYPLIARLTRREDIAIIDASNVLSISSFPNELAVRRLWEALQVVGRFGVSIGSIVGWTGIVNPEIKSNQRFTIAHDLKEAIKARFEQDNWQLIAQPIFDKLRQRQRDALAAHIMHEEGFASMEQLYEYFLIDPGMEPVVQTTRIRLAIGSVQLFIQRCLLNLEELVDPSVISTEHWEWMKRYRIWEANRKIFLFPENWLEPEFRDDKTHLFSELEGSLLKGDVSDDLVEDAFFKYLNKLEKLARLEIVAMHMGNNTTLHVIGRTYNDTPEYFYRRYDGQWTPWEPVATEITGNHLAPIVWRNRLYLFWVTFTYQADNNIKTESEEIGKGDKKAVEVQLHWSEYLQGKWSTSESGKVFPVVFQSSPESTTYEKLIVPLDFEPKNVFVYARKEEEISSQSGHGVYIVLEDNVSGFENGRKLERAFYLAGRNSSPILIPNSLITCNNDKKYGPIIEVLNNRYSCKDKLTVDSKVLISQLQYPSFTILACNNDDTSVKTGSDYLSFFYQDTVNTFFVKPSVEKLTIGGWSEWTLKPDYYSDSGCDVSSWDNIDDIKWQDAVPYVPDKGDPIPDFRESYKAIYEVRLGEDLIINPRTATEYDGELIGQNGLVDSKTLSPNVDANSFAEGAILVKIQNVTDHIQEKSILIETENALERAGLMNTNGGINVVGNSGLNRTQAKKYSMSIASTSKAYSRSRRTDR